MKKTILKYLLCKYELFKEKHLRKKQLDFIAGDPPAEEAILSVPVMDLREAQGYIDKLEEIPKHIRQIYLIRPSNNKVIKIWHRNPEGIMIRS